MIDLRILAGWPEGSTFLCLGFVSGSLLLFALLRKNIGSVFPPSNRTGDDDEPACYPPIEPLPDFDWKTKEPIKIRPFKPKYHLTMSMLTQLARETHRL